MAKGKPKALAASRAAHGLTRDQMRRMRTVGLPLQDIILMLVFLGSCGLDMTPCSDGAEMFAGIKMLTRVFVAAGAEFWGTFEINDEPTMQDMCTVRGFLLAFYISHRIKQHAMQHWATVCSSWSWVNRKTSERSWSSPLGNECLQYVVDANLMVSRVSFLILYNLCRDVDFIHENPLGSIIEAHPRWQWLWHLHRLGILALQKVSTWMGMFGAPSPKPTALISSAFWISHMKRRLDRKKKKFPKKDIVRKTISKKTGRAQCTGGKDLKATQGYPYKYAKALQRLHEKNKGLDEEPRVDLDAAAALDLPAVKDSWEDARIPEVFRPFIFIFLTQTIIMNN